MLTLYLSDKLGNALLIISDIIITKELKVRYTVYPERQRKELGPGIDYKVLSATGAPIAEGVSS